jgi:hypothetical protein
MKLLNYIYFFAFLIALVIIDFNVIHFLALQVKRAELAVEKFFFILKLRFEIWQIKRGFMDKKFERMADDILKEHQTNETD